MKNQKTFTSRYSGLRVARRKDFPEYKFTLSYLVAIGGAFELELTHNYDQKEPYELGNGDAHLGLGVKDMEISHQQHEKMGFQPQSLNRLPGGEAKFYFLADPDGYLVEVVRF